jgi:DNA-binding response OmpR family regulator
MRKRAVIFDDEPLFRRALWIFFDQRNYEVLTFPEPGVCPLHVHQQCPCPEGTLCSDLVISDVNMFGKNGIDYIEELMKKGCRQQHLALMSGGFSDVDRERAAKLGCALFDKPLDMDALMAWVESVEKAISPERKLFDWA